MAITKVVYSQDMTVKKVYFDTDDCITVIEPVFIEKKSKKSKKKKFKGSWLNTKLSKTNTEPKRELCARKTYAFQNGKLINEFDSLSKCAAHYGLKVSTLSNRISCGISGNDGIYFKFDNKSSNQGNIRQAVKSIDCFDENGEVVKSFASIREAEAELLMTAYFIKRSIKTGALVDGLLLRYHNAVTS